MNFQAFIFVFLLAFATAQDVSVPSDLLETTTKTSNVTDVEYSDEVTDETTEPDPIWVDGNDDDGKHPPPDSLIRPTLPTVTPLPTSNCTIVLPPNFYPSTQPPIIIAPIVNSTIDRVEREETLVCPVGSTQVGNSCNATYSNECPRGYTFNAERSNCVIKFTNCPLNFELNEFGRCVQRQICPHNHVLENGRCRAVTQCPTGWTWNGEKCNVANIQCQSGSVLRGNECVIETFTCPIGFDQVRDECHKPKLLCPPGYEMKSDGFCSQITFRCPSGSVMTNGECLRTTISCPNGTYQVGSQCYQIQTERPPTCPTGFYLAGNMCYQITIENPRPTEPSVVVCPSGTYQVGNACYMIPTVTDRPAIYCPPGFYRNGDRCLQVRTTPSPVTWPPIVIVDCPPGSHKVGDVCFHDSQTTVLPPIVIVDCPPGSHKVGDVCFHDSQTTVLPPILCPPGSHQVGDVCYHDPSSSTRSPVLCPPGFYMEGNRCFSIQKNVTCPVGYYQVGTQCYPNVISPTLPPEDGFTTPKTVPPTTPNRARCPDGFVLFDNQCYRCPPSFNLCENKCVKSTIGCGQPNYPNININIYSRDHRAAAGNGYNIINQIEPINNTIINVNNVTHPVTLHNVNENNIYVYSETQCPDGSIRTVVVKNNETINGCVDVESKQQGNSSNPIDIDDDDNEGSNKCCEIVTPRQCKKRDSNQWVCTHRRYKYCGKFCIADRLYLKPPSTTYNNQILTIVPSQPVHNAPPCFGQNCPAVDCGGCIDGSFNCSPQCYTYPCNHAGCHYLNQEDFCAIVGGQICEPER